MCACKERDRDHTERVSGRGQRIDRAEGLGVGAASIALIGVPGRGGRMLIPGRGCLPSAC